MPFYDYQCANNHRFELKQSFSSEPVATCPTCSTTARRLINLVPVHFKGSGFYVNDYARKSEATGEQKNGHEGHKDGVGEHHSDSPSTEKAAPAKAEAPKAEAAKPKADTAKAEAKA